MTEPTSLQLTAAPQPAPELIWIYPESLTVSGANNLGYTVEYVRADRYTEIVKALHGLALRPNCWCPVGHWWTHASNDHSARCLGIRTLLKREGRVND